MITPAREKETPQLLTRANYLLLLILLISAFAILCAVFHSPAITVWDGHGYWGQAAMIVRDGRTWTKPDSPLQFGAMHWLPGEDDRLYCRYSPGLAVIIAPVYAIAGPAAALALNPIFACLALLGFARLILPLAGRGWALTGTVLLAVNPMFMQYTLQTDGHMSIVCIMIWGAALLLEWASDNRWWKAGAGGLLLGCIPVIRNPDVVFGTAFAALLLTVLITDRTRWKGCVIAGAAALFPILPLLIYNHILYGAAWKTGYHISGEATMFASRGLEQNWGTYLVGLLKAGAGPFCIIGPIGMAVMCGTRKWRNYGIVMLLGTIVPTLFYMSYNIGRLDGPVVVYMRFLLPVYPLLIAASVWLLAALTRGRSRWLKLAVPTVTVIAAAAWGFLPGYRSMRQLAFRKDMICLVQGELEAVAEDGDIVIADSLISQHLDYVGRWRLVSTELWDWYAIRNPGHGRRPRMPRRRGQKKIRDLARALPKSDYYRVLEQALIDWQVGTEVFFVGEKGELDYLRGPGFWPASMEIVRTVPLPVPPPAARADADNRNAKVLDQRQLVVARWK